MIPAATACGILSVIKFWSCTFFATNLHTDVSSLLMFNLLQYRSINEMGKVIPNSVYSDEPI